MGLSCSHGAWPQDLIPVFIQVLDGLDTSAIADKGFIVLETNPALLPDTHEWWQSKEAEWLLEFLFAALDALAPEGYYFGAHPGDGSDFGFWEVEENDV